LSKSDDIEIRTIHGDEYDLPLEGSLGLLALGYVGLMKWREKMKQEVEKSIRAKVNDE